MTHDAPESVDTSIAALLPEIMPVAEEVAASPPAQGQPRPSALPWLVILALVVAFGYLSDDRRAALGAFGNQVADVIRDFRGYDPEV